MEASRAVGIGMSERHSDQIVPLKINDVSGQFFGNHNTIGKQTGKTRIPKRRERLRRCLLAHYLDYIRRRNKPGVLKPRENRTDAEEMVGVAVSRVNRREVLAARRDPIDQGESLLDGEEGVDEDSVPLAGNAFIFSLSFSIL